MKNITEKILEKMGYISKAKHQKIVKDALWKLGEKCEKEKERDRRILDDAMKRLSKIICERDRYAGRYRIVVDFDERMFNGLNHSQERDMLALIMGERVTGESKYCRFVERGD